MSETSGSTNTMQISFGVFGEVKVDDDVHGLDIDTTGQ